MNKSILILGVAALFSCQAVLAEGNRLRTDVVTGDINDILPNSALAQGDVPPTGRDYEDQ